MSHEKFMNRAFELAQKGLGFVSTNPMVGCVIVKDGDIIGEGYHQKYGEAHAEVQAIRSVKKGVSMRGSTVYVTLEPCAHFGKTPPCADALVSAGVGEVIIANVDPNPKVNGGGIRILEEAGIAVTKGVLESKGNQINKRFFTYHTRKRPYVILKWAQTEDGFIARKDYDSKWISNQYSRQVVHKWRTEEDGILVGYNTAKYDNPQLTAREWYGRDPLRMVIDPDLSLPSGLKLFDSTTRTLCLTKTRGAGAQNLEYVTLPNLQPESILEELRNRKIQSLIVEGGKATLDDFIKAGLWDEARVFTTLQRFSEGIQSPAFSGRLLSTRKIQNDELKIFVNESNQG